MEKDRFLGHNRERILKVYKEHMECMPVLQYDIEQKLIKCGADEALAVKYLYGTMPYSDMGNYPFETFLDFAFHGVLLWNTCEAVRSLPEEIFLNYILYHRVNEEEIRPCRSFFYDKIKDSIKDMDSRRAALELNYWCAKEVTYQSTDNRTLSARAVFDRGNGRCGEESTFTVNVLRSAGIPARQVYAPKWSHCDDNHAWVEILIDKKWRFLGACEPAEIVDTGWFTHAASRAMMVHSRLFDMPLKEQEITERDGIMSVINELERYASVQNITVEVLDEKSQPVRGAKVYFEVINYSAYASVAKCLTNNRGKVSLTTGLGSLHIFTMWEGKYAETWMDTRIEHSCTLKVKKLLIKEGWTYFDMIAPSDTPVHTALPTKEQKRTAREKISRASLLRKEKVEQWYNPQRQKFLNEHTHMKYREMMLETLTQKDQTDLISEVLEEHLECAIPYVNQFPEEIFVPYVLNPRIDDEVIGKYRRAVKAAFTASEIENMRRNPREIWNIIEKRVKSCLSGETDALITVPEASLRLGIASQKSREILFVAIARTLGIPARLNQTSRAMEFLEKNKFVEVLPENRADCTLVLKAGSDITWNYFQNWSIARLSGESYDTLKLSDELWKNRELTLGLKAGIYRILTTRRLPNGNIFASQYDICLAAGQTKDVFLKRRSADLADMLVNIPLPDFTLYKADGSEVKKEELINRTKRIFMFLEVSEEPTEHILNEMLEDKEAFAKCSSRIIFILRSLKDLEDPTLSKVLSSFTGIQLYYDTFEENLELLGRRMYVDFERLPLIFIADETQNGIYAASGYNVGTGSILLSLM
jgi:hypothetical protein